MNKPTYRFESCPDYKKVPLCGLNAADMGGSVQPFKLKKVSKRLGSYHYLPYL
jgi:hypothetical protein